MNEHYSTVYRNWRQTHKLVWRQYKAKVINGIEALQCLEEEEDGFLSSKNNNLWMDFKKMTHSAVLNHWETKTKNDSVISVT